MLCTSVHGTELRKSGYTLVEAVLTLGVISLFVVVCLSAIVFCRVSAVKAKEQAIAMSFLEHYAELIRAMPFAHVAPGFPINPLFDGVGGAPNLRIPASEDWLSVATEDYLAFHPDLTWLENRDPEFRVLLQVSEVGGEPHTKHVRLEFRWRAPLGRGDRIQQSLDLIRVRDL